MTRTPLTNSPELVLCELPTPAVEGLESFSPFCLKVHRALRAARLLYTSRQAMNPRDFSKLNPLGQVPILLVDDEPVFDSKRIVERINELSSGSLTRGLDARARAEAILWEEFADTVLNGFVVAARWADEENWGRVQDAYFGAAPWAVRTLIAPRVRARVLHGLRERDVTRAGMTECWNRFERTLDALEARAPEYDFWLGRRVTSADIALFGQLRSVMTFLTPVQAGRVATRLKLARYVARVDGITMQTRNYLRAAA